MNQIKKIKSALFKSIKAVCESPNKYCRNPKKDFTRRKKLPMDKTIKTVLGFSSKSLTNEMTDIFSRDNEMPSVSAFVQQRAKILPLAFEDLFKQFTNSVEIVAIAESTPGPIAINAATFIGYRVAGFLGALAATLGVVLPSFAIITVVSFVLTEFQNVRWIQYAFNGIRAGVLALIVKALWSMYKQSPKGIFAYLIVIRKPPIVSGVQKSLSDTQKILLLI